MTGTRRKGESRRGWARCRAGKGPCRGGSCPWGKGGQNKAVHVETKGTQRPTRILGPRPFSTSPAQTPPRGISCITSATRDATCFVPNHLCPHYTTSKREFSAPAGLHRAAVLNRAREEQDAAGTLLSHTGMATPPQQSRTCHSQPVLGCRLLSESLRAEINLGERNEPGGGCTHCHELRGTATTTGGDGQRRRWHPGTRGLWSPLCFGSSGLRAPTTYVHPSPPELAGPCIPEPHARPL